MRHFSRKLVRFISAAAIVTSSLVSALVWTPVEASPVGLSFSSLQPPPPIDPGESRDVPVVPPEYVRHEVVTPLPVSLEVSASPGKAAPVDGLPVTLTLVPGKAAPSSSADAPSAGEQTETVDTVSDPEATPIDATDRTVPVDAADRPVSVRVESLDAETVSSLGGEVLAFGVEPAGVTGPLLVEVKVDYSSFRYALGADWSNRLQLVQWSCVPAMAKVAAKECGNPVPIEGVVNDLEAGVLTATVDVSSVKDLGGAGQATPMLVAGGGSTLGLASAAGSFQATTLSNSGAWSVGGNTGSFSYNMPLAVPPAFNGVGPSVSLSYDSSAIDGVTSSVNSQPSEVGAGWSLNAGQGFIERRYLPCTDSRIGGGTSDSCWFAQNATISLNGQAGELVPINGTTGSPDTFTKWRLKDDPDWLVERVTAGGEWWVAEHWKVTTPEGMVYWFGRNDEAQNSRLVRPLRGISSSSDPCWYRSNKLCTDMPYRWMLDKVEDPYGNTMIYKYWKEQNKARTLSNRYLPVQYDSAVLLTEILYGKTPATSAVGGGTNTLAIGYRDRVLFSYVRRCVEALSTSVDAHCPAVTNANGDSYPDTPTDLYCLSATDCPKDVSFFQIRRLSIITTYTRQTDAAAWSPVAQWRTYGAFPDPGDGGNEKLWLYYFVRVAPDHTVTPPTYATTLLPGTIFGGVPLQNRKDGNPGAGVPYMNQYRVSRIFDDLGQEIRVTYESPSCSSPYNWSTNTTNCFPMYASFSGGGAGWGVYRRWVVDKVVVHDLVAGATGGTGSAPDITTDYTYAGAAWHHDGDDWWVDTPGVDDVSWGQWRGYQTVTTTVGTGTGANDKTVTKQVFYQGMHGDKAAVGTKNEPMDRGFTIPAAGGSFGGEAYTGTIYDYDWLAGSVFESYQMDGITAGFMSASRSYSRWTTLGADGTITRAGLPLKQTLKWRLTLTHSVLRDGGTGSTNYKYSRVDASVDSLGRTVYVHNSGFMGVTGDETCQRTRYLSGSSAPTITSTGPGWMNLVAQSISYVGEGTLPNQTTYTGTSSCAGQPVGESKQFYSPNTYFSGSNALDARTQPIPTNFKPIVTASLTRIKNWDGSVDALDRWIVTRSTVDAAGRVVETFDGRGTRTALFSFDTNYGYANRATYPLASVGFTQSVLRPSDGQPESTTDQNGHVTNYCYDNLSRLSKAYQPQISGATPACSSTIEPTVKFTYNMGAFTYDTNGVRVSKEPAIVTSSTLLSLSPLVRKDAAAYIDGFGRTRETQQWSTTSGKMLVTATLYDDRGNAVTTIEPFVVADTPGDRVSPTVAQSGGFATYPALPGTPLLRTTTATFDTAGRTLSSTRRYGATVLVAANTEYLGTKTISKPQLGSWQATTVDGQGRTSKVETYNGAAAPTATGFANACAITTYGYSYDQTANSPTGNTESGWATTTVTDDAGYVTTVLTDLAGRTDTSIDPNAGTSKFTYDGNGNVTSTTDAKTQVVNTEYDVLNRPTGRWSGTAASFSAAAAVDKLASWTYDTAAGSGKGMPATETSWQPNSPTTALQYTTSIVGYTNRYKATESRISIPSATGYPADPLAGVWKFQTTYNEAGQPVSVYKPLRPVDPANPNTPLAAADQDITTTHYDGYGLADQAWEGDGVTSAAGSQYVTATTFDDWGRVTSRTLTRDSSLNTIPALLRSYEYDTATGDLSAFKAGWSVSGTPQAPFQYDKYTRDAIGRVTMIEDLGRDPDLLNPLGEASNVKECFLYDNWNRLVRAHTATITPTQACKGDTDTASSSAGSLDPYDTVWAFDDVNRMTSSKDMLASGTPVTAYNHSDTNHPHAISSLSGAVTASYVYDANGAMETRAGDSLTYDVQQRLTKYASSETYIYGTSNQRLIRQAGGTRTLYLPGMEVTVTGATRTITFYLTIGATQIGTKTVNAAVPSGYNYAYTWSCGSMQNSNVCQATVYTTAVTPSIPQRKRYTPYGDSRQTIPITFPNTDRGFLNQPEDANGLTYLNNRYYDPALAAFTSADPLVGKTGHPYLYGNGNPTTLTDANGLCASADRCDEAAKVCNSTAGKAWDGSSGTCGAASFPTPGSSSGGGNPILTWGEFSDEIGVYYDPAAGGALALPGKSSSFDQWSRYLSAFRAFPGSDHAVAGFSERTQQSVPSGMSIAFGVTPTCTGDCAFTTSTLVSYSSNDASLLEQEGEDDGYGVSDAIQEVAWAAGEALICAGSRGFACPATMTAAEIGVSAVAAGGESESGDPIYIYNANVMMVAYDTNGQVLSTTLVSTQVYVSSTPALELAVKGLLLEGREVEAAEMSIPQGGATVTNYNLAALRP